jgi:cobalt-precorrin-5B (C1)-methyltransferase
MGDFAGGLLKYLRQNPVPRLTIAGGIGKLTKLSQGAMDLHSGRSQVDFTRLAELAARSGADSNRIANANTALEALEIAGPALAEAVAEATAGVVTDVLRGAPIAVEIIVTNRQGTIQARRDFTQ